MDALKNYGLLALAVVLAIVGIYLGSTGAKGYDLMAFLAGAVAFCAQIVMVDTRKGVLATALLAAGCNAYLLYGKFAGATHMACSVDDYWDCLGVNSLPESELFGIPVTLYGLGFYLGLAIASLGGRERTPRFDQINGLFGIVALGFSGWLGYAAFAAGKGCIVCITIYACAVLLLWAAFKGLAASGRSLFEGVDRIFGSSSLWLITACFALVTLIGASAWRSKKAENDVPDVVDGAEIDIQALAKLYARPQGTVRLDGSEPRLGKRDATIKVVEFADYGCPHCAQASPELKRIVSENPEVQLLFRVFPLSGACNPAIEGDGGVERCKAAMAAECAGNQGRYYELSSLLFKNLGYHADENLAFMAKEVEGLDFERWVECMSDPSTIEGVMADARAGIDAEVHGTPTLFVQGLLSDDAWVEITAGPPALEALVAAVRKGAELPAP